MQANEELKREERKRRLVDIMEFDTVEKVEKYFFMSLHIPYRKLTDSDYLQLLTLFLIKHRDICINYDMRYYQKTDIDYTKTVILRDILYWATGWDWKNNHIPDDTVKFQNKVRKYFKLSELTKEQIHDYDFTNKIIYAEDIA